MPVPSMPIEKDDVPVRRSGDKVQPLIGRRLGLSDPEFAEGDSHTRPLQGLAMILASPLPSTTPEQRNCPLFFPKRFAFSARSGYNCCAYY
jgi:hypothetical protein